MTPTEEQLTGATVGIVPIEPWDFVTENGQGPYFVGRPRHERGPATEILSNRPTAFNLTCIPEDRATERTPLTSVGGAEASL
jgi:hypothetical protein